ncbi:MAG: patatin-like phospholipase family protein [Pseudonocardiales bacterium]|nr:patatin-like phospholipase family protein [Pseudonocardiales bacterium]
MAFVLSGGASLGAIQVGMLRALFERRITPDLIIGTSIGALNGTYIASRPAIPETADALADIWLGLHRFEIFPPDPITGLLGLIGLANHFVPSAGLRRLLCRHQNIERLEDATIPVHVVATDARSGTERRLSRGLAQPAVMASAAMPGVFPAVKINGDQLIDGGVASNTPTSDAVERGARTIYVLPTGHACNLPRPPRSALAMAIHANTLLLSQRALIEVHRLAGRARLIVLPPPCPQPVHPADFRHTRKLIDGGYTQAASVLDDPDVDHSTPHPG